MSRPPFLAGRESVLCRCVGADARKNIRTQEVQMYGLKFIEFSPYLKIHDIIIGRTCQVDVRRGDTCPGDGTQDTERRPS